VVLFTIPVFEEHVAILYPKTTLICWKERHEDGLLFNMYFSNNGRVDQGVNLNGA
jgi:hypothetical protein